MEDYLGKAANEKQEAKTAIKEKRFDDAWRRLNNQKEYYLRHAGRMGFSKTDTLVLDSSPHEDMANILRLEGKHVGALSNISYTYKAIYSAKRPVITLEKKLEAYYNQAYKKPSFNRFLSLLQALPDSDFVSVRNFVELYYPMAPNIDDESVLVSQKNSENNTDQEKVRSINDNFFEKREQNKISAQLTQSKEVSPVTVKKYPEPRYVKTSSIKIEQNKPSTLVGYPITDWILGVLVSGAILIVFIWLMG